MQSATATATATLPPTDTIVATSGTTSGHGFQLILLAFASLSGFVIAARRVPSARRR